MTIECALPGGGILNRQVLRAPTPTCNVASMAASFLLQLIHASLTTNTNHCSSAGMANFGYNRPEGMPGIDQGQRFESYAAGAGGNSAHHKVSSSIFGNTTGSKTSLAG